MHSRIAQNKTFQIQTKCDESLNYHFKTVMKTPTWLVYQNFLNLVSLVDGLRINRWTAALYQV